MEYIKKLANDETWDCATFSGMCRFVANGNYYELPKPIEELAENHNFSVYDAPTEKTRKRQRSAKSRCSCCVTTFAFSRVFIPTRARVSS